MKYVDIVDLDQHFDPVFKLADGDKSAAWATFIPTVEPFEQLLVQTLETFESHEPKAQRPLWIQGTYGTGKSHAASVISHLLDDDLDGLEPFLARMKPELAAHVRKFRQGRRILPIYLYGAGASLVHSAQTFDLAVESAVKKGLTGFGLRVDVPDDFDRYIDQIERNPLKIDWNGIIRQDGSLKAYAPTGQGELLRKLHSQNRDVLRALQDYFTNIGKTDVGTTALTEWLRQVLDTSLAESAPYSGAMIYWDEFTSVLELTRAPDIAKALEGLAEFCQPDPRLKLLIISHRRPGQVALDVDEQKRIYDRFKMVDYGMTNVTVYKILSSAILRKDKAAYAALVSSAYTSHGELDALIDGLERGGAEGMREDIRGLFPIHPYTAYLATLIVHYIGSSDRSIFMFLHDEERGFKKFIAENPEAGQVWLTPDALWDYFAPTLSTDKPERFLAVSTVYSQRRAVIEARGSKCTAVFKSMLLLNFLHTYLENSGSSKSSLLEPTLDNCEAMFAGTDLQGHIGGELEFLEEQGALHKMGSDYLVMSGATLPEQEVQQETELLEASYGANVVSVLEPEKLENLRTKYCVSSVLREVQVQLFHGGPRAASFHRKAVEQLGFHNSAMLHLAVILYAQEDDMLGASDQLREYASRAAATDPSLVILEALTPIGAKNLQNLVSYRAHAAVADRHLLANAKADYDKMANTIVDNWVQQLTNNVSYNVYVGNTVNSVGWTALSAALRDCAEQIFKNGFDEVREVPKTCWQGGAKSIAEGVLQAESLDDLNDKLVAQRKPVRNIFKSMPGGTYLLNQSLELVESAAHEPIGRLSHHVQEALQPMTRRVTSFNLGDCLQDLASAPFGLYENPLHSAALAFVLRPYTGRLYDRNGRRIGILPMRDVVTNLFKFWSEGKGHESLDVQFGTETEEHLVQVVKDVFGLPDVGTLMDARGQLRTWVDQRRRPLWSVKYAPGASVYSTAIDAVCGLLQVTQGDISEAEMQQLLSAIDPVSDDVRILLTKENLEAGFARWLSELMEVQQSADEAEKLYGELSRDMAGSPSVWLESLAREKALEILEQDDLKKPTSMVAEKVGEILGISPSDDLAMVQLSAREVVRRGRYPLFAGAVMAQTTALHDAIEALQEFVCAAEVEGVDAEWVINKIDAVGVDRVRHAVAPEALESAFGKWVASRLGVVPSPDVAGAAYQSLLVGTSDPTLCREPEAVDAFQKHPPVFQPPEGYKEKIRKRVTKQPAAEAQRLLIKLADNATNGWTILGQLLGEEEHGQAPG